SALLLSVVPASVSTSRQVLIALALITPVFVGATLSLQRTRPPGWVVPLSGVLVGIMNLSELYVSRTTQVDADSQVNWVSAIFWLGIMGAMLAVVGFAVGTWLRRRKSVAENVVRRAADAPPEDPSMT